MGNVGLKLARVLLPSALFAFLVGYPLLEIASRALSDASPFQASTLGSLARFTAMQALLSALASLAAGVPLGILYARCWHPAIRGLATASFALPSLIAVGAVALLLRGTEYRFGLPAVIFAHAFLNAPWIALATAEGIRGLPRDWLAAGRSLGATPLQAFLTIEAPWVARRVLAAAAQVFAICVMSFAIPLLLGGGPPVATLETEIYASVRGGGLALGNAARFALAQLALAILPWIALVFLRAGPSTEPRGSESVELEREDGTRSARVLPGILVALLWFSVPGVALYAHLPHGEKFATLARVALNEELRAAAAISFRIALTSAALACLAGSIFVWGASARSRGGRLVALLAALPAGTSPLVLCLGFLLAYSRFADPFEGSETGMVLVQTALFLPIALRALLPLAEEERRGWRRNLSMASRTLGATPAQAWLALEWPRWSTSLRQLFRLAFAWSFADVAAASFFGSERLTTIGMVFMRWMGQYRFDDVNAGLFWVYLLSAVALVTKGRSSA